MALTQLSGVYRTLGAQLVGEQIALDGQKRLTSIISSVNMDKGPEPDWTAFVVASETVAASIGHPRYERYWCFYVEDWLFRSKFTAPPEMVDKCKTVIQMARETESLKDCVLEAFDSLLGRLCLKRKFLSRQKPLLTKSRAKQLFKAFGKREGDFFLDGGHLICGNPSVEEAVAISYMKAIDALTVAFPMFPTDEAITAVQILLSRYRQTLRKLECRGWTGPDQPPVPKNDPNQLWESCLDQLIDLDNLERFFSHNLAVTDEIVEAVCRTKKLWGFRAVPRDLVCLGSRAKAALSQCKDLAIVDIESDTFGSSLRQQLANQFPSLVLQGN